VRHRSSHPRAQGKATRLTTRPAGTTLSPMADEPDIRHFVHERYRQTDARLDQILNVIGEVQRQLDNITGRLDRIEHRLELRDAPTLPENSPAPAS